MVDPTKITDAALAGVNPFTDDQLASRFSARHASELRYVAVKSQWLKWDGSRWCPETTLLAFELARKSCRRDVEEIGVGRAGAPPSVSSAKTAVAVERMAKADRRHATHVEDLDADDRAFTTPAATYDLTTAAGRPPKPEDMNTKLAGCACAPAGTAHPIWSAFLQRIAPDPELRAFLKRFCGYCLTGLTIEHKFVFAYGTGANGKSTFINTITGILGDYATVADVGTFIASKQERHPADVAKLHGYRLVVAHETEKGRRWDEAKIKSMTGGDKMTARFMRQDFFDFVPKFKLWIDGNHKPHLDNVDEAMRRRLLLVPFLVEIPVEERDPNLAAKLKQEWPAILRWMIDGCREWQQTGLAPPKIVTDATDEYFNDQDTIKEWLDDCTEDGGPLAVTATKTLFGSWKGWCDERNLSPGNGRSLSDALSDRGFIRKRMHGGARGFRRLVLKQRQSGDAG